MLLEGRNAVVFAAWGAIASEVSRRFAAEGATVWASARNDTAVKELVEEITASGRIAHGEQVDATDLAEIDAYLDRVVATTGSIDVVFNGIGGRPVDLGYPALSTEQSLDDFMVPVRLIVGSQFLTARSAGRHMAQAGYGSIVMLAAGLGAIGRPHVAGISAACAAVEGMTRSLSAEFGSRGIRVNCVRASAMPETRTIRETGAALVSLGAAPRIPTRSDDRSPWPRLRRHLRTSRRTWHRA